jgi:hypothetical protein
MATKTLKTTRVRVDDTVPFWKTHYINTQPDQTAAAQEITDLHTWIRSQSGIISFTEEESVNNELSIQIQYDDAIISDIFAFLRDHPAGIPARAVAYYQSGSVSSMISVTDTIE